MTLSYEAAVEPKARAGSSDRGTTLIESRAPATGELIGTAPVMGVDEVRAVVAKAREAQHSWGALGVEERCDRMLAFRDALVDRADELVDLLSRETGKPRHEALSHEVLTLADLVTFYARNAPTWLAPRDVPMHLMKHRRSQVTFVPRGVVGIISPWNFPLVLSLGDAVGALMTGSAVVIKPSEYTSLIILLAKRLWDEAGLPADLLGVVTGFGETGAALIDAGIQKMVFTGAVSTGRRVAAACGERLVPCVLELGGKAPAIVCDDVDVEKAARAIVFGGFANSGQVCISIERVYADARVHDALVERVVTLARGLRQGDPAASSVDVGAMTFPRQLDIVEKHVADAVAKGATLRTGGARPEGPGTFFPPTVLTGCTHEMSVMTQEIFGPIVPIMRVDSDDEAVRLANDSHLGLNAYVFTRDTTRGRALAARIEAGSVVVNDVLVNYGCPEVPFGGVKQSGYGRVHGEDALRDLAEVKHVSYDVLPVGSEAFGFPYTDKSYAWLRRGLSALFSGRGIVQRLSQLF